MYAIIEITDDSSEITLSSDKQTTEDTFDTFCDEAEADGTFSLVFAEINLDEPFGVDNGEFFGGEIIKELE